MNKPVELLNCAAHVELASATPLKEAPLERFYRALGPLNGAVGTIQREILP